MARETEWVPVLDAKGVVEPYREPGQGRGWLTLLLGLIVFAAFGGVVGYAYLNGLPGIGGEPPLIRAAAEPYRRAPSDRGGLEVANSSSSIVSVLRQQNEQPRVERILPPEAGVALESGEPEPEPAPEADAPADAETPAAQSQPDQPGVVTGDNAATDTAATATTALMPPPKPAPPVQLAAREPPATISALPRPAPTAAPPADVAQPTRPPVAQPAPAPPTVPPRVVAPPVAPGAGPQRLVRPDPVAPPAPQPPSAGAGLYRLQLTAVRSEAGLTKAWADLRDRYPTALASVSPQVERTQTNSGPLFRLQAGPFANREAAADACVTIRSTGGQCFIVGPLAP